MEIIVVVICAIVLLAAWRTGKGNLTEQDKTALKTGLLFATLWFGGLAVVVWASLQTHGIIGKLIGTFGFIGFVAVLFKFAEWYNKKQKQIS
jgi:chromate transport protein ChrA